MINRDIKYISISNYIKFNIYFYLTYIIFSNKLISKINKIFKFYYSKKLHLIL